MHEKKLLYFYVGKSTFIEKDINIFREEFSVHEFNFHTQKKWKNALLFIHQFFFLVRHILSADILVSQFSGYHSFLPALLSKFTGKPFLIVAGGTDCHSFPSIGYGNFRKTLLGLFTKWSYNLCKHISPKHSSLWECNYEYDTRDYNKQGIHAFMPDLQKSITVIPNGFNSELYKKKTEKVNRSFLTIAGNLNYPFQAELKGVDLIRQVATRFTDCSFTIVGVNAGQFAKGAPANIHYINSLPPEELITLYSSHTFYFQLSIAEGFPNSLCESMLCECVPIGSSVFSIPEIIGDTGFILLKRDIALLEDIVKRALESDAPTLGKAARNRISQNYPLTSRKKEILELCNRLVEGE
ncbi:MAG: glycosyltransferase family 4 protein [Bacteroidia bacterium]|nr:glycosyltransferase family 4 protein [Bacteroidia bacterium]